GVDDDICPLVDGPLGAPPLDEEGSAWRDEPRDRGQQRHCRDTALERDRPLPPIAGLGVHGKPQFPGDGAARPCSARILTVHEGGPAPRAVAFATRSPRHFDYLWLIERKWLVLWLSFCLPRFRSNPGGTDVDKQLLM